MKQKRLFRTLIILTVITGIYSCAEKEKKEATEKEQAVVVINFDDKQKLSEFLSLNLDDTHPNMLDPENSKADHSAVMSSWADLHQRIGKHLAEHNFTWGTEDSSITILQKIYFKPNGEIETYFFNVLDKGVPTEKKEQFAELIRDFAANNRIDFQRDHSFAQCGKTRYSND
jgi:hypothetical protein